MSLHFSVVTSQTSMAWVLSPHDPSIILHRQKHEGACCTGICGFGRVFLGAGKKLPGIASGKKIPPYITFHTIITIVAIRIILTKDIKSNFRFQGFGYELHGGKPYKFLGSSSKGGQAGTECRRIGAHLPTLGTREDVEAVQGLRGMVEYTVPKQDSQSPPNTISFLISK